MNPATIPQPTPPVTPATPPAISPFAQFQSGASYIGADGNPVQGASSVPTGTPYYKSSPLEQAWDGSTQSTTGTKTNPFAGFVGAQGGTFGSTPLTAANQTAIAADGSNSGGYYQGTPESAAGGYFNGVATPADQTLAEQTNQGIAQQDANATLNNQDTSNALNSVNQNWWAGLPQTEKDAYTAQGGTNPAIQNLIAGKNADGSGNISTADYLAAHPDQTAAALNAQAALTDPGNQPVSTAPVDPYGRNQSTTSAADVITPAKEAQFAAQAAIPLTGDPAMQTATASPFAQFAPPAPVPVTIPSTPTNPQQLGASQLLASNVGPTSGDPAAQANSVALDIPAPTPPVTDPNGPQITPPAPDPIGGRTDQSPFNTPGVQLGNQLSPDAFTSGTDFGQSAVSSPAGSPGGGLTFRPVNQKPRQPNATGNFQSPTSGFRPVNKPQTVTAPSNPAY